MAMIAVLGTGHIGGSMAENLLQKGHTVRVWNRSPEKLAPLVQKGAIAGKDPADTVRECERVHLALKSDDAVDAVIALLRKGLGKDVFVIDHSTSLPARVATRFAQLRGSGVRYLSAPVFMSKQNCRDASGLMLIAGPKADADALQAPLSTMTGKVWHTGERADLAAFYKLAGNAILMSMVGALGDLFLMAKHNGISNEQVLSLFEVWKPGAALPYLGKNLLTAGADKANFELGMARKDMQLMIDATGKMPTILLHALAAAMDKALVDGLCQADFAVFARRDR